MNRLIPASIRYILNLRFQLFSKTKHPLFTCLAIRHPRTNLLKVIWQNQMGNMCKQSKTVNDTLTFAAELTQMQANINPPGNAFKPQNQPDKPKSRNLKIQQTNPKKFWLSIFLTVYWASQHKITIVFQSILRESHRSNGYVFYYTHIVNSDF